MIERMKIYGVSKSKGTLDNGTSYDSAKVFAIARLKVAPNNNGFGGVQLEAIPAIYQEFVDKPFSFSKDGVWFDVEFEQMALRNAESSYVITSMKPVPLKTPAAA